MLRCADRFTLPSRFTMVVPTPDLTPYADAIRSALGDPCFELAKAIAQALVIYYEGTLPPGYTPLIEFNPATGIAVGAQLRFRYLDYQGERELIAQALRAGR